jgi:uncharacterized membrane protein
LKWSELEMSKKLTVIVTILFILSLIFTIVAYMVWNKNIEFIFQYVFYSFNVVLIAYMGKSGLENITKINISDMFKNKNEPTSNVSTIINNTVTDSINQDTSAQG